MVIKVDNKKKHVPVPRFLMHGLTNKEVAALLNIAAGNVGKKYGEIYASLGVENKNELIKLCKEGMSGAMR